MVQLADHLEEKGLVERRRSPDDRRVHLLTLNADGKRVLADAHHVVEQVTAQFTEPLGPGGAAELRQLLLELVGEPG